MYRLFLDDFREPYEVGNYIHPVDLRKEYRLYPWKVVKNYPDFVNTIRKCGIPTNVSFDHDLVEGHYHKNLQNGVLNYDAEDFQNDNYKTGFHCAAWLIDYVKTNNLEMPTCYVHSMNPDGADNIKKLLNKI